MMLNTPTPPQIVAQLDRFIVGQTEAKRMVAIALRNRHRRQQLAPEMRAEVMPKNILMIGPTGVGKTEIARRMARLLDAPFVKVEATKFTEVGYVGRDVESIMRDLVDASVDLVRAEHLAEVRQEAERLAIDQVIDYLARQSDHRAARALRQTSQAVSARPAGGNSPSSQDDPQPSLSPDAAGLGLTESTLARRLNRQRQHLARLVMRCGLDDEQIEVDLEEHEDDWPAMPVLEIGGGITPDEVQQHIQEFVEVLNSTQRRRTRRLRVRDARRFLTEQEAQRLVDMEAVVETAIERAEQSGVVFIDELDKIVGSGPEYGSDVSGEGVQRDLLPIIEGSTVMTRFGPVRSDHVLFVAAGAFEQAKPADLIPELQGRFPLRVELDRLGEEDLHTILSQPENALTKQYGALLATEDVTLSFSEDGLRAIAQAAWRVNNQSEDIGARRLHTILEKVLADISFTASEHAGETITIDAAYVTDKIGALAVDEDLSHFIL